VSQRVVPLGGHRRQFDLPARGAASAAARDRPYPGACRSADATPRLRTTWWIACAGWRLDAQR
jgi:hypothetical protein